MFENIEYPLDKLSTELDKATIYLLNYVVYQIYIMMRYIIILPTANMNNWT